MLPTSDPDHKRVENRRWSWAYRGLLAIHAGKSKRYMEPEYWDDYPGLAFGAVVGVVNMLTCVHIDRIPETLAWMCSHKHTEGPWCHVYANVRKFRTPIPATGRLGLWDWTPPESWRDLLIDVNAERKG